MPLDLSRYISFQEFQDILHKRSNAKTLILCKIEVYIISWLDYNKIKTRLKELNLW